MYTIEKSKLSDLFGAIAASCELYLPVKKAGQNNFAKYEAGTEYCEELKTVKSPKDMFFPQSENIVSFEKTEGKIKVTPDTIPTEKTVVFGVRACDVTSFDVLDKVFLSEPADSFYKARRENCTVVATACSEPEESCFCSVFGIDPSEPKADVATWFVGEKLYWKPLTEKGEELTKAVASVLTEEDADEKIEAEKAKIKGIVENLPLASLSLDGWDGDATEAKFDAPEWEKLSASCLGCGACTFVCPTCQCYDIRDYDTGHGIQRYRCWDSCMYNDFTMMAHGTPRPSQLQRFRQRFMHKLVYFPANNDGMYSCVGCGRCVNKCPISMNIAKVIKAFGGDKS